MNSNSTTSNMNQDLSDEEFDRLLDEHFSNDTQIKRSASLQLYYLGISDEKRKEIGQKITQGKLTLTKAQADEIWSRVWNHDRGYELYKKLAIEYGCALDAVSSIAHGNHTFIKINKNSYKKLLKDWHEQFGYFKHTFIIRSPGNDLLDWYDEQNLLRGNSKISKLSPSEIFNIRFRWTDKSRKKIKEYCDSKNIHVDGAMYDTYRDKTMSWLVDQPHKEWQFTSLVEMSQWVFEHANKKFPGGGYKAEALIKQKMIWSEKSFNLAGWSFLKN